MGLYLCVFEGDEELDGIEVGSYADFGCLRRAVVEQLEFDLLGTRFPTLDLHSDCEGEWSAGECAQLETELRTIISAFESLPPAPYPSEWQQKVAASLGLRAGNLCESFIDVDGQSVLERLLALCRLAQQRGQPILFQ